MFQEQVVVFFVKKYVSKINHKDTKLKKLVLHELNTAKSLINETYIFFLVETKDHVEFLHVRQTCFVADLCSETFEAVSTNQLQGKKMDQPTVDG